MENTLRLIAAFCIFLLLATTAQAAEERWFTRINAPQPSNPFQLQWVKDGQFDFMVANSATWPAAFTNHKTTASVTVGTDTELLTNTINPYDITVQVEIKFYNLSNVLAGTVQEDFRITYSNVQGALEHELEVKQYNGYHKISAQVISIVDNNNGLFLLAAPINLYMELEIEVERYYAFDTAITPFTTPASLSQTLMDTDGDAIPDEVEIKWAYFPGAERYDLEWTWVDNYGATSGSYLAAANVTLTQREFELNCTRVTITQQHYRIPWFFDRGFVVYRVRPRSNGGPDFKEDVFGKWSTANMPAAANRVADFPHYFQIMQEHDKNKNWQHSVNYAEDGKRKDLVNYHDGTLRNRQSVTRNNSDNLALAGETFYDPIGRPAIQTLPAPTGFPALRFQLGFSRNVSSTIYGMNDFAESPAGSCSLSAGPMSNATGAARYYSPNNPVMNNWQDFVPDAEGFPFTHTQYTPDQTGRITAQGGVGPAHQLGSGHETRYFYGKPFQEELDRLFGYDVGYRTRYQKNVVIDPNGQASISYIDAAGRTIATALAGGIPPTLEPVSDEFGQALTPPVSAVMVDLLNKDLPGDPDDTEDDNHLYSTGLIGPWNDGLRASSSIVSVTSNSPFDFSAAVTWGVFNDPCMGASCFPYVFDYELSLMDECGVEQFSFGAANEPLALTLGNIDISGASCGTASQSWGPADGLSATLPIGSYQLSKKITVNNDAVDAYAQAYIALGQANGCINTLQDFIDHQQTLLSIDDCETNCQECVSDLGPDDGSLEWKALYDECMEPCLPISPCQASYEMMLSDVSPGGQYGYVGSDLGEAAFSVFNSITPGVLPFGGLLAWRSPRNVDGTPSFYPDHTGAQFYVQVTWDASAGVFIPAVTGTPTITNGDYFVKPEELADLSDFLAYWRSDWAEKLVYYHPEKCYLDWCRQLSGQPSGFNYSSEDYDVALMSTDVYTDAQNYSFNGTIVNLNTPYISGNWIDPFFQPGMLPPLQLASARNEMIGQLANFQNSGMSMQNYAAYIHQCGTWYGSSPCSYTLYSSLTGADADLAWNTFKNLYLSTKQRIEVKYRDQYAIANNCYNGCMGEETFNHWDNDFAQFQVSFPYWTGSFFDYPDQPCGWHRFTLYKNKSPRFIRKVGQYDITQNPTTLFTESAQGLASQFYQATGRCPIDVQLEALLNRMTKDGHLLSPGKALFGIQEFTPELYQVVSGIDVFSPPIPPYQPYNWSASASGATLTVSFTGSSAVCNQMAFTLPGTVTYNWATHGTTWKIASWEHLVPNGGAYDFAVLVKIDEDLSDPDNPLVEKVITGTTCVPLGACAFDDLPCEGTKLAEELLLLLNALLLDGNLNSTTSVILSGAAYDVILGASSAIRDVLNYTDPQFEWIKETGNPTGFWLGNITQGTPPFKSIWIYQPSPFPANLLGFTNAVFIAPGQLEVKYTYLLAGVSTQGTIVLTLYSGGEDILITPEECCFKSNMATEVAAMLAAYLSGPLAPPNNQLQVANGPKSPFFTPAIQSAVYNLGANSYDDIYIAGQSGSNWYVFNIYKNIPDTSLCQMPIETTTPGAPANWPAMLVGISDFAGDPDAFTATGLLSSNETIQLLGKNCFGIVRDTLCTDCPPPSPPLPISCNDAYPGYIADLQTQLGLSALPPEFVLSAKEFCQNQYQYCTEGYLDYLNALQVNSAASPYYVSLQEFCGANYGDRLEDYLFYIDGVGTPSSATHPLFISIGDFVAKKYARECIELFIANNDPANPAANLELLEQICMEYAPHKPCPKWRPTVQIPQIDSDIGPCAKYIENLIQHNAQAEYDNYINLLVEDFKRRYVEAAISTVVEELNLDAPVQEYHYTLYYYDRAGNLVRTVPPRGVHPYNLSAAFSVGGSPATTVGEGIQYARKQRNRALAPSNPHNYLTTYTYNSLNQLLRQDNPDGGVTRFWYDRLGRMLASRSARQAPLDLYSYTKYDALGRIVEVGQLPSASPPTFAILNNTNYPDNWAPAPTRTEVTKTWYDSPGAGYVFQGSNPFSAGQQHLRNRIARVTIAETGNTNNVNNYERATHYSYDVYGNVETVVQENRLPQLVALGEQYKRTDYRYDLISGNVQEVRYQQGRIDAFTHRYAYDADNRLTRVQTSADGVIWRSDAKYFYYQHGPLARTELGHQRVQASDHAYTLHGWLKAVNANTLLAQADMGRDGAPDAWTTTGAFPNRRFARDAYGFSLTYYAGDYKARSGNNAFLTDVAAQPPSTLLWNGNIAQMAVALPQMNGDPMPLMLNQYGYDQLHRLKWNRPLLGAGGGSQNYASAAFSTDYATEYRYDNNGNLLHLDRNAHLSGADNSMDRLHYFYYTKAGVAFDPLSQNPANATNRLAYVEDIDAADNYDPDGPGPLTAPDLQSQQPGNYAYDPSGNLTQDLAGEIADIQWTAYGKVRRIERIPGSELPDLEFLYDPSGQRIAKVVKPRPGGAPSPPADWAYTWYATDAQGNPLAIYELKKQPVGVGLFLKEQMIYGSSRLGMLSRRADYLVAATGVSIANPFLTWQSGQTQYELSNHLGNVLATISDRKLPLPNSNKYALVYSESFNGGGNGGWTPIAGGTLSNTTGSLRVDGANTGDGAALQLPTIPGQTYQLQYDLDFGSSGGNLDVMLVQNQGGSFMNYTQSVAVGTNVLTFVAMDETYLHITLSAAGAQHFLVDNILLSQQGLGADVAYFQADRKSVVDYYPFGMGMVGREGNGKYRYGFNGMERDDELIGEGNSLDFGERLFDTRIIKWLKLDPMMSKYSMLSPYLGMGNNPIVFVDTEGRDIVLFDDKGNKVATYSKSGIQIEKGFEDSQFIKDFNDAKSYLNKIDDTFNQLIASKEVINIHHMNAAPENIQQKGAQFKPNITDNQNNTATLNPGGDIYWDPNTGLQTNSKGDAQSPATILLHEAVHAKHYITDKKKFMLDATTNLSGMNIPFAPNSDYDNIEEYNTINEVNDILKREGLSGSEDANRKNHRGTLFKTLGPRSTTSNTFEPYNPQDRTAPGNYTSPEINLLKRELEKAENDAKYGKGN